MRLLLASPSSVQGRARWGGSDRGPITTAGSHHRCYVALGNSLRPKRFDGREIRAEMNPLIIRGSEVNACRAAQVLDAVLEEKEVLSPLVRDQ